MRTRKNYPILIILSLWLTITGNIPAQGTWKKIAIPTSQTLWALCFTDSLTGWAAGDSGVILHTTDGGTSWVQQSTQTSNEFTDIYFLDSNRGWASSLNYSTPPYGTLLFKTTDGGNNWVPMVYPQENIFIFCIWYRNSLEGWMGGKPHALVKTMDGGQTWNQAAIDTSILAFFPVLTVRFYDEKYGYASGGMFDIAGVIWRTWNGGETWYAMDASEAPADEVRGIHMFDSIHVMGAGGDPDFGYGVGMTRTSNGGLSWVYDELDIQGYVSDIDFRNDTEAWAPIGSRQKLIYSLDAGTTWAEIDSPDSSVVYQMTFTDPMHGYAVGKSGSFLKYYPPVTPAVSEISREPETVRLELHPNPAEEQTTAIVRVSGMEKNHGSGFHVIITDVSGKVVARSSGEFLRNGEFSLRLDLSHLQRGIYFCRLATDRPLCASGLVRKLVVID